MANLLDATTEFTLDEDAVTDRQGRKVVKVKPLYCKVMRNACVAQVDFLGFANILARAAGEAAEFLRTFYQETELHARLGARTDGDRRQPTIALFQYADTTTIVARQEGPAGIIPVVKATAHLLASCHGRGLPARGGISMGEVWAASRKRGGGSDGDFVSGPGVAAAHRVESTQDWAGGAMDPRIDWAPYEEVQQLTASRWLVPYNVPWSTPPAPGHPALAVNWSRPLHVPGMSFYNPVDGIGEVLDCRGEPPQDLAGARNWRKRRAAGEFYEEHGPHGLDEHDGVYLVSPSGNHIPIHWWGPAHTAEIPL